MVLVPPGAAGLKFWRPDAQPFDKRVADAWNVEDKTTNIALSNSDKTATSTSFGAGGVRSTTSYLTGVAGKFYAEFLLTDLPSYVGIKDITATLSGTTTGTILVFMSNGQINIAGVPNIGHNLGSFVDTDILCIAWDIGAARIWINKNNGIWNNDASADPATGVNGLDTSALAANLHALWFSPSAVVSIVTVRTELADLTYSVPSGFTSWMGEAEVLPEVAGTGDLVGQEAAVSGTGDVGSAEATGTGALAAQAAAVAGAGASASIGSGALAAQASAVAGAGLSVSAGTGALQAGAAAVVGTGASASIGTGSLVAGSAQIAGTGTSAAANSGALVAQAATVAGLGVSASTGSGALQAGAAAIAGAGLVASVGTGTLVAGSATVAGAGEVIAAGAAVGTGALVAGAATLSGEGEVSGEVAPPVSVDGGGRYYPYRQERPLPVIGVGYAILPVEGEAHGLVLVAGAGAALPRISGAGTGAIGIDGRSAARLSIRAAAIGDRGLAGSGAGTIVGIKAAAIGRHDDDEAAAVLAFLLAA